MSSAELFGYAFRNPALLEEALTTPAVKISAPGTRDNQRLEFLGDAVLNLLAADRLYATCPREEEGLLTVRRTHMVSTVALCEVGVRHGLVPFLKRNVGADPLPPNSKTIADAVEAIIGAVWLDGGYEAARQVFDALGIGVESRTCSVNPKGDLQIFTQSLNPVRQPVYTLVRTEGRSDDPVFTVSVAVEGFGKELGRGKTKRAAEAEAAARLLARIRKGAK